MQSIGFKAAKNILEKSRCCIVDETYIVFPEIKKTVMYLEIEGGTIIIDKNSDLIIKGKSIVAKAFYGKVKTSTRKSCKVEHFVVTPLFSLELSEKKS